MRLSACMIVRNEEAMLGRCLESLKEFDEVVILDTGSTDNTREVALMYTNVYYIPGVYKWNDNFAEARNKALEFVTGEWVFIIDADEFLEVGGTQKIRDFISTTKARVVDIPSISEIDQSVHYLPRLFVKAPDIFYRGAIHNHLSVLNQAKLDVFITYGYSPAHEKDPDRALRILQKEVDANRNCGREKFYLAREFWYRNRYIEAVYWLDEYLKVGKFWAEVAEAHLLRARCLFFLWRGNEARDACLQTIKLNSNFQEALEFMAEMSGPGNRKRWLEFSCTADNNGLLFDRSNVMNAKRVYYCEGMKIFGERMIRDLGYIRYNTELDIYKDTFFEGLYFEEDYKIFSNHLGRAVVFWNGSDITRLQDNKQWQEIILGHQALHFCHWDTDVMKLADLGIAAWPHPLFFGDINKYQVSYKQDKFPNVYMTAHPGREEEYGIPVMLDLADKLPNVNFHIYGIGQDGQPMMANVKYYGLVADTRMDQEISHFQGAMKLLNADGVSQTIIKSALMAQYPMSINKIDGVTHAPTLESMVAFLNKLRYLDVANISLREKYLAIYRNAWNVWDKYEEWI